MITFKKFAMAIMLIAGFQQASADVCKLKVNQYVFDVVKHHGEAWVKKNGNGTGTNIIVQYQSKKVNISTYEACEEPNADYVHIVNSESACGEYNDAIFCNNKGEVVINLNGIRGENDDDFKKRRSDEAKRQFENIIKCGLNVPVLQCKANGDLIDEKKKQGTFNPRIFDTPFTVLRGGNWVCNEKWRMPAISADLSESTLKNVPVMCAMKRDIKTEIDIHMINVKNYINELLINKNPVSDDDIRELQKKAELSDKLLIMDTRKIEATIIRQEPEQRSKEMYEYLITKDTWTSIFKHECDFNIYATEHTERQLLAYHCLNNPPVEWLTDACQEKWCQVTPCESVKLDDYNPKVPKKLLIYTHGAPCFDEGNNQCKDNGGMCCWNLYRDCIQNNINVDVYFSQFMYHELLDNDRRKNILGKMFDLYALLYGGVEGCDKELENLYKAIFKLDYKRDETLHRELVRSKLKLENDCGKSYERFEEYLKKSDWKDKPNIQIHWVNHNY